MMAGYSILGFHPVEVMHHKNLI